MKRRSFLKIAARCSAASVALPLASARSADARERGSNGGDRRDPLVGVQIAPVTILDEGIEGCLDTLQEKAEVNALFIYSQTYHMGIQPANVIADDHGAAVRNFATSRLPRIWVRHRTGSFAGHVVQHPAVTDDLEYADRDLFREIRTPATRRGMKVYARILEAGARRKERIPGYDQVLTVDHAGNPGHGPCWNNPHYRKWVATTIRELVTNYDLDGLQYGAERTGPLSHVLFRGVTPTCFCTHCVNRNKQHGIDATRARKGFAELFALIKETESGKPHPSDGLMTAVLRVFHRYPEVLSWDYQWFQADEEICTEVHQVAKGIKPEIDSGRHVDHQRSSWDLFYRSAVGYSQMAENADFIKPILYHEAMGPRLRWWVVQRMQERILNELTLEQSLDLFYSLFGYDSEKQPSLDDLEAAGLGPAYVEREVRRCKASVGDRAKVYAGIGIDVPWYVADGMEPRPSDPEQLEAAVERSFAAGADGVLASREYNEMRFSSLEAFGRGVRASRVHAR